MDLPGVQKWMREKEDEILKRQSLSQMLEEMLGAGGPQPGDTVLAACQEKDGQVNEVELKADVPLEDETDATLTREERLQERVEYWQDRLLLDEWQVWSQFRDDSDDSYADINYDIYHFQATVLMPRSMPEEHWDWGIVHELLHLRLSPICRLTEKAMAANDKREAGVLDMFTDDHIEPVINRLADSFVGSRRPRLPK
jgi:hypothetical protein